MRTPIWFVLAAVSVGCAAAQNIVLKSGDLSVARDPAFPRIISYRLPSGDLTGNPSAASVVELNGKPATCRIACTKRSGANAVYQLSFPDADLSLGLSITVESSGIVMETGNLTEHGATKLQTLAFPANPLLTIGTTQSDAAIAACLATNVNDQFGVTFRERIAPLSTLTVGDHDVANYFFLSAGGLAGGIASSNFTDTILKYRVHPLLTVPRGSPSPHGSARPSSRPPA